MNANETTVESIDAREVPEAERPEVLPRHFGRHMLTVEQAIYTFMRELSPEYTGGYWRFLELTNGGFYMAPEGSERFELRVDGNGFDGQLSADAAGITACLFAFSHLSFQVQNDSIAQHYHLLRQFALDHPEAGRIFAAID
ncbi:MAG: antirestriction protein [Steroidobacteraceae bacterium]